ncbi:glycerophosphoryl diester phosphodiesterase [Philodulcilactobacillus myokoensis]|uniref:Glycerophosphoryl diester phosphodiesterase n=1 Tax=Philodulcilactobacillus myokoensis TaxID=2929573 RepID=A0A9W6B0N7_9LACO|nr:glycerophosphodiester phosphodiesterase family protein [Philodulcilactobacillus myokoensis]GLB46787.1 glycerophosphoryl diester phosphodiesterase [Philodulcilactobacillus myokoensis]
MLTKIIAHRGNNVLCPENTLKAFQSAIDVGTDGIETDVHLSKDHHLIIMHDEKVDRTTNRNGLIKDLTLNQLKKLDDGRGEKIPTLNELIQLLIHNQFKGILNLELKTNKIEYPNIEKMVVECFQKYHFEFHLVYSSFNANSIYRIRKYDQKTECAKLFSTNYREAKQMNKENVIETYHPDIRLLKAHPIFDHQTNIRPWTVDAGKDMDFCFKKHYIGLITNDPKKGLKRRKMTQGE